MEHHSETYTFLQKIIDTKTVPVYSALTELEFWTVCLKLEIEKQEGISRDKVTTFLKKYPKRLKDYTEKCAQHMELFVRNMLKIGAIKIQIADVIKDKNIMQKATLYNLYTYDTIQIATTLYCDLDNIAVLDKHFREKGTGLNIYTLIPDRA